MVVLLRGRRRRVAPRPPRLCGSKPIRQAGGGQVQVFGQWFSKLQNPPAENWTRPQGLTSCAAHTDTCPKTSSRRRSLLRTGVRATRKYRNSKRVTPSELTVENLWCCAHGHVSERVFTMAASAAAKCPCHPGPKLNQYPSIFSIPCSILDIHSEQGGGQVQVFGERLSKSRTRSAENWTRPRRRKPLKTRCTAPGRNLVLGRGYFL